MSIGLLGIGKLDRRVIIQSLGTGVDAAGQEIKTVTNVVTVWMGFREDQGKGGERFIAQQVVGRAVLTFITRWRSGVTVKHVLFYDNKTWDIHDVREIGRRGGLEIDASARAEG
jgi:SPP1 family predicted phage head-tail adaptor